MHIVVCALIVSVFTLDFIKVEFGLPLVVALLPEALSGLAFLMALRGFMTNGIKLPPRYLLYFGILLLTVISGLFVAEATTGPLVGGIRFYCKYIPFLLLPMACPFSSEQLRQQMLLILLMALMQFPITFLQRFVWYIGESGDEARGTLTSGSQTAIVLLCAIAVVVASNFKRGLSAAVAVILCLLLFLPPTIAEVKGALVLVPFAIAIPFFYTPKKYKSRTQSLAIVGSIVACVALFSTLYYVAESTREGRRGVEHKVDVIEFLTDPSLIIRYMAPQLGGYTSTDRVGRWDAIAEPFQHFNENPLRYFSGLGMGALSEAPISAFSADQYVELRDSRTTVGLSMLLWEFGVLGTLVILLGLFMVWRDAVKLRHLDGLIGTLALGFTAVIPILFFAMFWKNPLSNPALMSLIALFAGHMISASYRTAAVEFPEPVTEQRSNEATELPRILNEAPRLREPLGRGRGRVPG